MYQSNQCVGTHRDPSLYLTNIQVEVLQVPLRSFTWNFVNNSDLWLGLEFDCN